LSSRARNVHGVKVVSEPVDNASAKDLERLVDAVREDLRTGVVVLGSVQDSRIQFVVGVTKDLTQRVKAGDVVKQVAGKAGGGGGGPPHFATGGGTQPAQLGAALEHAFTVVQRALQGE
jgi:alanyl-tRNA synthetase